MRLGRVAATFMTAITLGALHAPARADAEPLCRLSPGPSEYQSTLGPLVSGFVPAPPAPGQTAAPPRASTGVGAANLAREALGAQYAGVWLSNAVQGWVVGLAPGPLGPAAARRTILERIAAHYTPAEAAHLSERLHVDPQPYGDGDLRATQDAVAAVLLAEPDIPPWSASAGCRLSDARRVEVGVYQPATPEQFMRVVALLAPFGDRFRAELLPYGGPSTAALPGGPQPPPTAPPAAAPPPVVVARHVKMALGARCVRGGRVRIAARGGQPRVTALTVQAAGRRRTIGGPRLRKPLTVVLRAPRTRITVTVRLAGGRVGTRTVTYARCR